MDEKTHTIVEYLVHGLQSVNDTELIVCVTSERVIFSVLCCAL